MALSTCLVGPVRYSCCLRRVLQANFMKLLSLANCPGPFKQDYKDYTPAGRRIVLRARATVRPVSFPKRRGRSASKRHRTRLDLGIPYCLLCGCRVGLPSKASEWRSRTSRVRLFPTAYSCTPGMRMPVWTESPEPLSYDWWTTTECLA